MVTWIALCALAVAPQVEPTLAEALACEQRGDDNSALSALERLVGQHPAEVLPHLELARLKLKTGRDLDRATYDADIARALAPENPRVHFVWALVALERGDQREAVESLARAVLLRPDYEEARHRLAGIYLAAGRWSEAETQYRMLATLRPQDAGPKLQLAKALEQQGKQQEAERELRSFVDAHPQSVPVRLRLAELYERSGRSQLAAAMRLGAGRALRSLRALKPSRR